MSENKSCILIFSGGMDSYTLLCDLLSKGYRVKALSFNYGQRHEKELEYAMRACAELGVDHKVIDVRSFSQLLGGSALTDCVDVPEGHYEDESMRSTVVANRNMVMMSMAISWAVTTFAGSVATGVHAGDHAIYPDCRPEFIAAMGEVAAIANYHPVKILTPYINLTKGEIAQIGRDLSINYVNAWTCYNGREKACGKCGACQERMEAMTFAGIQDPMEYE